MWRTVEISNRPAAQRREELLAVEQSTLRSVDSEWAGRVIEPRNCVVAGVDTVQIVEDNTEAQQWPSAEVPPGSESTACT
jgi:hypothetical protein